MRCALLFAVAAALFAVPFAFAAEERPLCGKFVLPANVSLSLSDVERRLVCGDPKSTVWQVIPDNQAIFFLKSFFQTRGHYTPKFERRGGDILVIPGPQTFVKTFTVVEAPEDFHPEEFRRIRDELLTPKLLNAVTDRMIGRLRRIGFPCGDVKVTAGYDDGEIVALVIPGPRQNFVSFEADPIEGLMNDVFSRHQAFHLGDRYDADLLALTRARVLGEGAVQGTHFETTCPPTGAAVVEKFVPGPPRVVSLGAGIDTENIFIFRSAWRDARLGPGASSIEVSLTASWREQELRGLTNWYVFSKPSRWYLRPSAGIRRRNEIPFEEWHLDTSLSLASTWDNSYLRLAFQAGPQFHVSRVVRGVGTRPSSEYVTWSSEWRLLTHDFELNRASPKSGWDVKLTTDSRFQNALSDVSATALRLNFAHLWNVGNFDPALFVIGVRGGIMTTLTDDPVLIGARLPPEFRHYLGGSTDLRGFARKQIPSEDRPGAGSAVFLGVELRLADLLPHGIQPFLFCDIGKMGKRSLQLEGKTFLSPGLGIRWQLPFAVFRATVARGLVVGSGDSFGAKPQWTFYLSLGRSFEMKLLLRILRRLFLGVIGILGLVAAALLVVWLWPGLVINDSTIPFLLRHIPGVNVKYRSVEGSAHSNSFLEKSIWLEAEGLCVNDKDGGKVFLVCGEKLALDIAVRLGKTISFRLDRGELLRGEVRILIPASEDKKDETKPTEPEPWIPRPPEFLKQVSVGHLRLDVPKASVAWAGGGIEGVLDLELLGKATHAKLHLVSKATLRSGKDIIALDARTDLASLGSQWYGPYHGDVAATARGKGSEATVKGTVRAEGASGDALGFHLTGSARDGKRRLAVRLDGIGEKAEWNVRLSGTARGLAAEVPALRVSQCRIRAITGAEGARATASSAKPSVDVNCGVLVTTAFIDEIKAENAPTSSRKSFVRDLLREVPVTVRLNAEETDRKTGRVKGTATVIVEQFLREQGKGVLRAGVDFSGEPNEFPKGWKAVAAGELRVADFKKLVEWLQDKPWAVPEPFASLGGTLEFRTEPEASLLGDQGDIPLVLRTRLHSFSQSFDIDGAGKVELRQENGKSHAHLKMKFLLTDIRLVLPRFGFEPPPPLVPDGRIKKTVSAQRVLAERLEEEKEKPAFTYEIEIVTPPKPVRLVSDIAQAPFPITVSLNLMTGASPRGLIHIGETPATFFGHHAELRWFNITLGRTSELTELDAEIQVHYTDYTVRILINGLATEPKIKYFSEPPLPEEQVLAVLLFGKKMDMLDRDQARSASNMQSGIADGAVTLASMYLLASTPVESIGYDPATRSFSAKIRLADGTSLNLGARSDEFNQVGIRHRLDANWAVTTYLTHPLDSVTRSLTAFLEWSKGY